MSASDKSGVLLTSDVIAVVLAVIFLLFLLAAGVKFIGDFLRKRRYLKLEIARSEGRERLFWKRCLRRLWLSLIPFVKY